MSLRSKAPVVAVNKTDDERNKMLEVKESSWLQTQRDRNQPKMSWMRTGLLLMILFYFAYSSFNLFNFINARSYVTTGEINTLCRDQSEQYEYCNLSFQTPPHNVTFKRFSKFLMFETDAWPIYYAPFVVEHYKEHGVLYTIDVPGPKFSHAIYTSHLTGQAHTNYKGTPIAGDSLIKAMKRADPNVVNYTLQYVGPEWSFLAIVAPPNMYNQSFAEIKIEQEPLDKHFKHPYPYFFETGDISNTYSLLFDIKAKNQSLIAHSGVFDHRQHGEHRHQGAAGKKFPATDKMARDMQEDFKKLKDWIDENPEYLLILLSDHGVDEFGISGYKLHGESFGGNEPFMLLYNPTLETSIVTGKKHGGAKDKGPPKIDVVDVCPTLAMYLEGLDIPADNIGVSLPYFGAQKEALAGKALKQTIHQQVKVLRHRGIYVDENEVRELLSLQYTKSNQQRLYEFAMQNKERLFYSLEVPWENIASHSIISMAVLLITFSYYNYGFDWFFHSGQFFSLAADIGTCLVAYFPLFFQFLFCWHRWKSIVFSGKLYRLASPLLAFIAIKKLHTATSQHKAKDDSPSRSDFNTTSLQAIEKLIFINEFINFGVVFAREVIHDFFLEIEEIPFLFEFGLVISAIGVLQHYRGRATIEKWIAIISIALIEVFILTEHKQELYFIGRFHVAAFITYFVGGLGLFCHSLFSDRKRLADLMIPLNIVLLLLFKDNKIRTLLLIVFNYQYHYLLLPILELISAQLKPSSKQQLSEIFHQEGKKGVDTHSKNQQLRSIIFQLVSVYSFNQVFFSFVVAMAEKMNFDVQPFAGKIGLMDYDGYPNFSATLMVIHKYGIFFLYIAYFLRHCVNCFAEDNKLYDIESNTLFNSSAHTILQTLLLFATSNVGFYLLSIIPGSLPNMPDAATFTVVGGVLGILQCVVIAVYHLKSISLSSLLRKSVRHSASD